MSDKRLTALTEVTAVSDSDYVYVVDVSDTTDSADGTSKKALIKNTRGWPITTAETAAGVTPTNYQYEPGNVLRYGTNSNPGTTDMTTAIQAAIDSGRNESTGRTVKIPNGIYLVSDTLNITSSASQILGEGIGTIIRCAASMGATTDVFKVDLNSSFKRGLKISNFQIDVASGTPARHGIHLDITDSGDQLPQLHIDRVWVAASLGGRGLYLTNPTNTDGLYTIVIEKSWFRNGIYMQRAGDSLCIKDCVFTGSNAAIEIASQAVDAKQIQILRNNITSAGGAIVLTGEVFGVKIQHNQIEQTAAYTGSYDACIAIVGDSSNDALAIDIKDNSINNKAIAGYAIHLDYTEKVIISGNDLSCATASGKKHINITANSTNAVISETNRFISTSTGNTTPALIDDSGVGTSGVLKSVSSFSNSWVALDATNFPVQYKKDSEGYVTLYGSTKDGTTTSGTVIFTIPAGFRPDTNIRAAVATATGSTYSAGVCEIDTAGQVKVRATGGADQFHFSGISFKAA